MNIPFLDRVVSAGRNERSTRGLGGGKVQDPVCLEQFRGLRAKIEYKVDMLNYRVLAITSAIAGEGKTMSSANLGVQLASSGRKKVLLVDLDMRKADLAQVFGIAPLPGLTEYLSGTVGMRDAVRTAVAPGLSVVPAGTKISSPMDLLGGEKFKTFIKDIRGQFDIILLDTPPVLPVADTLILKDQVDAFIFLFRAGFTPYPMLKQAIEEVGEKSILGVVLNGVEPKKEKYYQRYYGKYYKPGNTGQKTS